MNQLTVLACALTLLAGCSSMKPTEVVQPREVTLEQALISIGCGLKAMDEAQNQFRTGLFPSEVEVKLELAASASDNGKLALAMTTPDNLNKIGIDAGQESKASRSNTITIKFTNVLGMQPNTLVSAKSPEELAKLFQALKTAGITTFTDKLISTGSRLRSCD